jgi:uncharacterized protein (DUF2236 family)
MPSQTDAANRNRTGQLFSPHSKIWQVDREMALLLAGGRALLLQLAHPKVAAGVAHYSRFQQNPLARLQRTMSAMWSIVFDQPAQARSALQRLENIHAKVHGTVPAGERSFAGTSYNATDQELLLWVHATLIDSAMIAYELFVGPMTGPARQGYYEDSKKLATLFGIEKERIPLSVAEFEMYMDRTIAGDTIAVGATAKQLADDILYARPWIFKIAGPLFRFVTTGLLPEKLRGGYGLSWSRQKGKMLETLAKAVRIARPLVPAPLRIVPNARVAENANRG